MCRSLRFLDEFQQTLFFLDQTCKPSKRNSWLNRSSAGTVFQRNKWRVVGAMQTDLGSLRFPVRSVHSEYDGLGSNRRNQAHAPRRAAKGNRGRGLRRKGATQYGGF